MGANSRVNLEIIVAVLDLNASTAFVRYLTYRSERLHSLCPLPGIPQGLRGAYSAPCKSGER